MSHHSQITRGVTRTQWPNGLTLLVRENHSAPVVALVVLVKAGYFHEPDHWNGISHVVEHMLFKGTYRRPGKEQIARAVRALGGSINASTYYEETCYHLTVPAQHLEAAVDILTDLVRFPCLDPEDLRREIEVIVQESQQKRDTPAAMLIETLYALAHDTHRIRRWRIGSPEVLRALTCEDLLQFMRNTYVPGNIIVSVVGDVRTEDVQSLIERFWADMPPAELHRESSPLEPPHDALRYRRITGDVQQRLFALTFQAPPVLHEDAAPLAVLDHLLSDGRSSRLYRHLREELRVVNSIWASYEGFQEHGLFTFGGESIADDPLTAIGPLWEEVERIKRAAVTEEELERVKTRIETRRLFAREEALALARSLAQYEALNGYRWLDTVLEQLRLVTPEDVQRVASRYLLLEQGALLEYLPHNVAAPVRTPEDVHQILRRIGNAEFTCPETGVRVAPRAPLEARELPLPGGGRLRFRSRTDLPVVAITAVFPNGKRSETRANCGITNLMLKSMLKGTRHYTAGQIAERIERLGSSIGISLGADYLGFGIKLRVDNLQEGFALFQEVLRHPCFPPAEVEREKQAIHAELRRLQDNSFALAMDLFHAAYFGEEHPYGLPSAGIAEAIACLTPEDLYRWHQHHITPQHLVVGMVGDLTDDEAEELWVHVCEAWTALYPGSSRAAPTPASLPPPATAPSARVLYRDRKQTVAVLGFAGVPIDHPDRPALDVLSAVVSGMSGRFFRAVRGENALAYQVTGFHHARRDAGYFVTCTATDPQKEERARDILLAEIDRLRRERVDAEELTGAQAAILGHYVIGMQTFGAQAGELAGTALHGLPLDEPRRYLERVRAVTAEDVLRVAQQYLVLERYWLGVVRGTVTDER
ncbi:MAG: pitrilysin family protein [Chloroherpetonaceae bacterium]|nr:insulinase family protein [Chthonomonadaceae bacterium]MDW8208121.1 pitrilysin family protein [Chloroherpetonaceae bacterium]